MIHGIYETHLQVSDLERSAAFYEEVVGLKLAHSAPIARFYWVGEGKEFMLGLWLKEPAEIRRQHFAFRTTPEEMKGAVAWLKERGLTPRNHPADGTDRPYVHAWMPAASIYFDDPDGHSLEFLALLPDEPRPELGQVLWSEWERLHGRG